MIVRSSRRDNEERRAAIMSGDAATVVCQVLGCSVRIPRRHLMCRQHWFEVPADLRLQVEQSLAFWLGRKQDVRPYLKARVEALLHVARLHGNDVVELEAQFARWS